MTQPSGRAAATTTLHATCVAFGDRAVLITGRSGSGKSALALDLLALGCRLVADDRVDLSRRGDRLLARAPAPLRGLIEARGVGLLHADVADDVAVDFCVDLDRTERRRLPDVHHVDILGCRLTCLGRVDARHFSPAVLQMLKRGRWHAS